MIGPNGTGAVDGSSGGGMTIGGTTGAVALAVLGGWFFELHSPAEPVSAIWSDVGLTTTLHRALSMSCSSLGLDGGNKGSGSGWSTDGQKGSGGRGRYTWGF